MCNYQINLFLCMFIFLYSCTKAEFGCMDTSYHMACLGDPKQLYIVEGPEGGPCPCPCSRYCATFSCNLKHGRCPVCGHIRVPRTLIIIKNSHDGYVSKERSYNSGRFYSPALSIKNSCSLLSKNINHVCASTKE